MLLFPANRVRHRSAGTAARLGQTRTMSSDTSATSAPGCGPWFGDRAGLVGEADADSGDVDAVGDALEDLQAGDLAAAVFDLADVGLRESADCCRIKGDQSLPLLPSRAD
ncbi:hypothetical protein [Parafrankia sp. BMG5.11]|uniref:hypothetical protein n=1 Tax=Parafrankia sp. BMG5.11 TaxID=222540 RepID=UPI001A9EF3E2|nr:hypothetical protein [Parafrankia sp. BMG5.11]